MSDSKILTSEEVEAMLLTVRADGLTPLTLEQRDDLLATVRHLLSENEKLKAHVNERDSLLSAPDQFDGPCVSCGHNNYDAERRECAQRWMEGRMSVVCGCPCAKHNSLDAAVNRMRSLCVEKVRSLRHKSEPDDSRWNAALYHAETQIESLTLQEQKS